MVRSLSLIFSSFQSSRAKIGQEFEERFQFSSLMPFENIPSPTELDQKVSEWISV